MILSFEVLVLIELKLQVSARPQNKTMVLRLNLICQTVARFEKSTCCGYWLKASNALCCCLCKSVSQSVSKSVSQSYFPKCKVVPSSSIAVDETVWIALH